MWSDLLSFAGVGFAAQLVDGAIGMAYGITATSVLLTLGTSAAVASASVHAAEIATTAASGLAHWRFGNVDLRLATRLALPGMVGAGLGAWVLTSLPNDRVRPLVSAYLLVMGCVILWRALRKEAAQTAVPHHVPLLGFAGGLLDAIGGGGWGAMVTSTLIGQGVAPRIAIGSANAAELLVTTAATTAFIATIGIELWPIIAGLILGGIIAAPMAAYAARHMPARSIMLIVALAVIALGARNLMVMLV
jgi:hypothetical protein